MVSLIYFSLAQLNVMTGNSWKELARQHLTSTFITKTILLFKATGSPFAKTMKDLGAELLDAKSPRGVELGKRIRT